MAAGLYNLDTKEFIEVTNNFTVGQGDGCNLSVKGDDVDLKQAQFKITESGHYILNLNTKNDVLVNMKRLPDRFFIPLEEFTLIIIGEENFLFSLSGPVKSFKVNEIAESYEDSSPSDYDLQKLDIANRIQDEIDSLNGKLPDYLKKAGGIKNEIEGLLKERKTFEAKIKGIDEKIKDFKDKFEANKTDINPIAKEIKLKKSELAKILKDLAHETGASKLELDL